MSQLNRVGTTSDGKYKELRQKAQQILDKGEVELHSLSQTELQTLVQELQIHQVELEIQNEELRDTQLRLMSSRDAYMRLYDFAPNGYCTLDRQGCIRECNLTFSETIGERRGHLIGRLFSDFIAPESQDKFYIYYRRLLRSAVIVHEELSLTQMGTSSFDVQLSGMPLQSKKVRGDQREDEQELILLSITDISPLKSTERRLDMRLQQQAKIAELSRLALSTTDLDQLIEHTAQIVPAVMNVDFCTVVECDEGDQRLKIVSGDRGVTLFISSEVRAQAQHTLKMGTSTLVDDFSQNQLLSLYGGRQLERPLTGICSPIHQPNGVWGMVCVHSHQIGRFNDDDVCFIEAIANVLSSAIGRRKIEDALQHTQKLESLGVLAAGVAHDFNNLLTVIMVQNSLAMSQLPDAHPVNKRLNKVDNTVQKASDLTRQLLAYVGQGQFKIEPLSLDELVSQNISLLEATMPRHVVLLTDFARKLPTISADIGQMQQVVMNLVINAAEAYDECPGQVRLVTKMVYGGNIEKGDYLSAAPDSTTNYVQLSVIDQASGIDPMMLQQIFDPFFTTKFTGRGLGLAAVQGIVHNHGGLLTIQTVSGIGTTFNLFFPAIGTPENVTDIHMLSDTHEMTTGKYTILCIDDDDALREGMSDYLEMVGHQVITAANGQEGLTLFKKHQSRVDVILLDLTMPVMSGSDAFVAIRALSPDVPIIIVSGYGEEQAINRLNGAEYTFVQKPFNLQRLCKQFEELVTVPA